MWLGAQSRGEWCGGVLWTWFCALCRRLQTPQALSALLRVRCCPELRIARAYGRLVGDADHEHLFHCVACDPYDSVAFDLALTTRHGFQPQANGKATHPVIQVRSAEWPHLPRCVHACGWHCAC